MNFKTNPERDPMRTDMPCVTTAKRSELTHIRFYFPQIDKLRKALNDEQMGRLFFAVADYARTGTMQDVPGDILYPYEECVRSVDKAQENRGNTII